MPTDASPILYDVFISYARKDANLGAAPLDSALKRDFRVWRDTRDLPPEQDFTAEIEKAIKAAARLIVCVTPDVEREDSFVRREIAYAQLLKKPLLVARFADVIPPIHVVNHTWIDFFKDWDASLAKLLRWLRGEAVDSAAPVGAATLIPAADPYRGYVERLYADVIESLRVSVFSTEAITLRAVESPLDVPGKSPPRINPKFLTTVLRDQPAPKPTAPAEFASLHEAYASAGCDGRVLLLGEPGAGKTTSLLAFARDAAAARLSDASQSLPIFARISGWDSQAQTPLADWLTVGETDLSSADLRNLIDTGSALLLLDGLDELGDRRPVDLEKPEGEQYDPRERFLKLLPPSGKLILSSRLEEYRQIETQAGLSCAVRLQRLDDAQMTAYLADLPDLWAVVQADEALKEALRTPLLLALFRVSFEEAPEEARTLRELSAGELNERIWDVFIERRWEFEQARSPDHPLPYSASELKSRIGDAFVTAISEFHRTDSTRFMARDLDSSVDANQVIRLAKRLDLLVTGGFVSVGPFERPDNTYRCLHLRLRDTLVFSTALHQLWNQDKKVRQRAIEVLGRLGDVRALEHLSLILHDTKSELRDRAADALGKLGDVRAFAPLCSALIDLDQDVRYRSAYALGRLGDGRALEPLIFTTLHDESGFVRGHACTALGALGDKLAFTTLLDALHDSVAFVRACAADALGTLGDARAVDPLCIALNDPISSVRVSIVDALGEITDIRALKSLSTALQDPSWNVRSSAADALGKLGDPRAIEPLLARLLDPDGDVRTSVAVALGKLGDVGAIEKLISAALHDPETDIQRVTKALRELGDEYAITVLCGALNAHGLNIRRRAAAALEALGDVRAFEPLVTALRDPDNGVRRGVVAALGKLRDVRVVSPLIATLSDTDNSVCRRAATALEQFPDNPSARAALEDYYAGKIKPRDEL